MLDGDGPTPFYWWLSRLTEEFPCYGPEEAYRAWLRLQGTDQSELLEDIIEARAYARAKQMTDDADTPAARQRLPSTPLFEMVTVIEFELAEEATSQHGPATDD